MPLMNTPFQPGTCVAAVRAMEAGPRRDIAWAEYCYFTGQPDKAARAAGAFVAATSAVLLHRCAQHQGYDGSTLTPQGEAARAQAATVLMRFCEQDH